MLIFSQDWGKNRAGVTPFGEAGGTTGSNPETAEQCRFRVTEKFHSVQRIKKLVRTREKIRSAPVSFGIESALNDLREWHYLSELNLLLRRSGFFLRPRGKGGPGDTHPPTQGWGVTPPYGAPGGPKK